MMTGMEAPQPHRGGLKRRSQATYDRLASLASGRRGFAIVLAWAIAEATVWPIIPDFVVAPMAVATPRRWYVPLTGCLVGMAVGGGAMLLFSYSYPAAARGLLANLPLTRVDRLGEVSRLLTKDGPLAWLIQPWSGVPFKTWTVAAATLRVSPVVLVPAFILGRGIRVGLVAVVSMAAGGRFAVFARDHFLPILGLYVVLFAVGLWRVMN
jgi:membrane protein YqaA with SNARE-associated domain